jgi:hypothetical protein
LLSPEQHHELFVTWHHVDGKQAYAGMPKGMQHRHDKNLVLVNCTCEFDLFINKNTIAHDVCAGIHHEGMETLSW